MGLLGISIAAFTKVSAMVAMCLYINKNVLTATLAEYKLVVSKSALSIIMVIRTFGLASRPSQTRVAIWSVEP